MAMKRVEARYSGRVQGVGFRFTAMEIAQSYPAITGFVRNTGSGGVEVVAEGPEDLLKDFMQKIESQMQRHIHDKQIIWGPAMGEFKRFGINY